MRRKAIPLRGIGIIRVFFCVIPASRTPARGGEWLRPMSQTIPCSFFAFFCQKIFFSYSHNKILAFFLEFLLFFIIFAVSKIRNNLINSRIMNRKSLLMCSVLLLMGCLQSFAQEFLLGDLRYQVLSYSDQTVEVCSEQDPSLVGDIDIPDQVFYDGVLCFAPVSRLLPYLPQ